MVLQAHHERRSEDFEKVLFTSQGHSVVIARSAAAHGEPVEPRGNLVEVEHAPGNHHCYGDEIATPVSSTGSQ